MPILRTPDHRFAGLADFPFAPHYLEHRGARVHYVDEGRGEVLLCLHGIPAWSYFYRGLIARLSPRYRVVAPDFIGFGRSDKFSDPGEYSYELFVGTVRALIDALGLDRITLIGHDGGCVSGLIAAAEAPERFSRLVIMNTDLPTGLQPTNTMFEVWRQFVQLEPDIPIEIVFRAAARRGYDYPPGTLAAYGAPFPDRVSKVGAVTWALMAPTRPGDGAAPMVQRARDVLGRWEGPAITIFSEDDPIYAGAQRFFRGLMPTLQGQPDVVVQHAGHFLLEEQCDEVVRQIEGFLGRTPLP